MCPRVARPLSYFETLVGMETMIILLMALTFATAASVAVTQEHPDVAPALAAIEFATREVPSDVSLLVEAESSPPEALSEVADALDASVAALDSVVTCPPEAPIDPCRIAPGMALVGFRSLEPDGASPRFAVYLWQHDPFREEVYHSVVGVALGYGREGWEVTEVFYRGAS